MNRSPLLLGRAAFAVWLASAAMTLGAVGCIPDADMVDGSAIFPDQETFRPVSEVLERRCGELDCHGTTARAMRLYSQYGLRKPDPELERNDEYVSGGEVATTDAEVEDNYSSACGLEPELMRAVVEGDADLETLTLIRKPRLEERHKGGAVWKKASNGDICLTAWILGKPNPEACRLELEKL